jgi:diphthamide biosynthesis enzyme Dph1/Dph2-like protein
MQYDLEMERVVREILDAKPKKVCVQLPDGLKQQANKVQSEIESKTDAEVVIYLGSCFGACDFPVWAQKHFDMLIAFGHSEWRY